MVEQACPLAELMAVSHGHIKHHVLAAACCNLFCYYRAMIALILKRMNSTGTTPRPLD
jgi:hypothetical protein